MSLIWLNGRCRKFSTVFFILVISFILLFFFCFRSILIYILYTLLKIPRFLRNSLNMMILSEIWRLSICTWAGRRLAQFIKYLLLPIRGLFLAIRGGVCRATISILTLDPISDQDERGNPFGTFMWTEWTLSTINWIIREVFLGIRSGGVLSGLL